VQALAALDLLNNNTAAKACTPAHPGVSPLTALRWVTWRSSHKGVGADSLLLTTKD
jgi:hypothetical protein